MWITNGIQADWMCMLANTGPPSAPPHLNKSLICVPLDSEGVQRARKIEKLGMDSSDTAQIYFDNVKVSISAHSSEKIYLPYKSGDRVSRGSTFGSSTTPPPRPKCPFLSIFWDTSLSSNA